MEGIVNQVYDPADPSITLDTYSNSSNKANHAISPRLHRFPHCLVWTPIPLLTWLCPLIGHLGIADLNGVIYDFAAPYTISEDQMAFGWPVFYCQLDLRKLNSFEHWDRGLLEANRIYAGRVHNLCCDNCHSHVAYALNRMRYAGRTNWNMFGVALLLFSQGRYVNKKLCLIAWLPFLIIVSMISILTLWLTLR